MIYILRKLAKPHAIQSFYHALEKTNLHRQLCKKNKTSLKLILCYILRRFVESFGIFLSYSK